MSDKAKEMTYAEYQSKYINLIQGDVMNILAKQKEDFTSFLEKLDEKTLIHRYAEDKWTLAEVILHIIDTEQIFNYRFLCGSRGESQHLPGFDQDEYISNNKLKSIDKEYLINYFTITRYNSLILFKGLDPESWDDLVHMDNYSMSLSAFPYMVAGHLQYHMNIINERYMEA